MDTDRMHLFEWSGMGCSATKACAYRTERGRAEADLVVVQSSGQAPCPDVSQNPTRQIQKQRVFLLTCSLDTQSYRCVCPGEIAGEWSHALETCASQCAYSARLYGSYWSSANAGGGTGV